MENREEENLSDELEESEQEQEHQEEANNGEELREEPEINIRNGLELATTKDLKLRMPEFKGKKGRDPQVNLQAFES